MTDGLSMAVHAFASRVLMSASVDELHVNAHKTEYMCFNRRGDISTLNDGSLKLVDQFTLLNTPHYKVDFKVKVEQSRERSSALPYT